MSSNIRLPKICQHCGEQFIAKTTVTKYCSDPCAKRAYKKRKRKEKISESVDQEFYKSEGIQLQELKYKEFLSVKETCLLLGISRMSLYRYFEKEIIPHKKVGGRVIISRKSIDKLFE